MGVKPHTILNLVCYFQFGRLLALNDWPIIAPWNVKCEVAQKCIKRQLTDRYALHLTDITESFHKLWNISHLFASVRTCSVLNKNRARVDENYLRKIVFFASFKIKEIDALLLIGLAHTIPLHSDSLCIFYVDALLHTPGAEGRHLPARHVIEVSEVAPHVKTKEVVDALGECLLGMTVEKVVGLRVFGLRVWYADGYISLTRFLRLVIDWALRDEPTQNSILVAVDRKLHGVAERMGEPLFQVWLDLDINYEFAHISVIKNTAKLGKIIEIFLCL